MGEIISQDVSGRLKRSLGHYTDLTSLTSQMAERANGFTNPNVSGTNDDTTFLQAKIDALKNGETLLISRDFIISTVNLKSNITILGAGGSIIPVGQTGGRLLGNNLTNVRIEKVKFKQTTGYNYNPTIYISNSSRIYINKNEFIGCGYGAKVYNCDTVEMNGNYGEQIGIYPRPAPLDPSTNGFGSAYELYGCFLRADTCTNVKQNDNKFSNQQLYGGHLSDNTGGAGAITNQNCNGVEMHNNNISGACGQGILLVGELQNLDVPTLVNNGTINDKSKGSNISVIGNTVYGSNQEGITIFGVRGATVTGNKSRYNRYHSIECWDSRDTVIDSNICDEAASTDMLLLGANSSAGDGSIVIHRCDSIICTSNKVLNARSNGVYLSVGTQNFVVSKNIVGNVNLDSKSENYRGNGYTFDQVGNGIVEGNILFSVPTGKYGYYFTSNPTTVIKTYGNTPNSSNMPLGFIEKAYTSDRQLGASDPRFSSIRFNRVTGISQSAITILDSSYVGSVGNESALVLINGTNDSNGSQNFIDLVLFIVGASPVVVSSSGTNNPPARTYAVSGNTLQLTMVAGTYSVRLTGFGLASGNIFYN
jgi:hypothetical protein